MGKKSANELLDRILTDEDFAASVADPEKATEMQAMISEQYFINESELSTAVLDKFQLSEEQLDSVSAGKLSDISARDILEEAIGGAQTGAWIGGIAAGPAGIAIGAAKGAAVAVATEVVGQAIDSLFKWRW